MEITIRGPFEELDFDAAYGVAKRLVHSEKPVFVKRKGDAWLCGKRIGDSVVVTVKREMDG